MLSIMFKWKMSEFPMELFYAGFSADVLVVEVSATSISPFLLNFLAKLIGSFTFLTIPFVDDQSLRSRKIIRPRINQEHYKDASEV